MTTKIWVIVIAVVVAAGAFAGWSYHERKIGELNGTIAHLLNEQHRVDTVYKTKTVALTKIRHIADSVISHDTVFRDTTVKRLILGERQACDAVIQTCEQRVAYRDSIITVLKRKPSVWSHLPWILGGIIAGKLILK